MTNYLDNQSWVRSSSMQEGEGLYGLGASAFDTGSAAADAMIADANRRLADLLRPMAGAIDSSPLAPEQKLLLKTQPVSFYLQLFGMFENLAAEIIVRANQLSGKQTRTIGIPGINAVTVDMNPDPPSDAAIPSTTGRHIVRVLRIADLYMVLVYQAAPYLAQAAAQVLAKYGLVGGQMLGQFINAVGSQAAAHAQVVAAAGRQAASQAAQQAVQTGQNVQQVLQNAAQTFLQNLPPPPPVPNLPSFSFRGLGAVEAAAGAQAANTAGAATTTGAATGVASTPFLATLLTGLIGALLKGAASGGASFLNQQAGGQQGGPTGVPGEPGVPPGPNGDTNGRWESGKWIPNTGLAALAPYALPIGLGLGALVLLTAVKK